MKIFQYWDTGEPPEDVARMIESFRVLNPGFKHRLFDRDAASWYIRKRLDDRAQRAFDACRAPAMQADVFRLAALWAEGGVYADADILCLVPIYMLIKKQARPGLIVVYRNRIQNGFIVQKEPRDPFIGACLELAIANIEARRFSDVYTATGPAIYNALWALIAPEDSAGAPQDPYARDWDAPEVLVHAREQIQVTPELVASFRSMTLLHQVGIDNWMVDGVPAYRQTSLHWYRWQGSIYHQAA